MIPTVLALVVALPVAAGADPPTLVRDKEPPKEWDRKAIAKAMPHNWDAGPVHVLAWEIKEDDRPFKYTRCLVVKKLDKPTDDGERWILGALYYDEKRKVWEQATLWLAPDPKGKTPPAIWGYEFYRDRPLRSVVMNFLKERGWTFGPEKHWAVTGDGPAHWSVTRLLDGGVCAATWKSVLGHTAPDLFAAPALAPPPREKK
jgi:hypothetical protein